MAIRERPRLRVSERPRSDVRERPRPRVAAEEASDGRVRAPWTRVLFIGAGAFALWFLLFAPTLQHNAQVSPVGTRRTVSLDLVGPVAALSRGLQLSHVVSLTGREDGQPSGTGGLVVAGPRTHRPTTHPSAAPGRPTTTPTTNPKLPTAAAPLHALIVGDSVGLDVGGPLQYDLAASGVVNAALDGRESTGLTRPDYFNWPVELASDLTTAQPQVVVVMIGANDPQDFPGPPDVPFTSPRWNQLYAQRVAQFMQIAQSTGAAVYWVGMPPMQDPGLNAQIADINAVVQQQAALQKPAVTYLSTDKVLGTAQGGYSAFVTNSAGQVVPARAADGTHITAGGGQIVAQLVIGALRGAGYHIP
jgi:lysophospholipase L1-like esterase